MEVLFLSPLSKMLQLILSHRHVVFADAVLVAVVSVGREEKEDWKQKLMRIRKATKEAL